MSIPKPDTTDEEMADLVTRLAQVLYRKMRSLPKSGFPSEDEWLESIVGTTVADTWLVLSGTLSIEAYEGPQ